MYTPHIISNEYDSVKIPFRVVYNKEICFETGNLPNYSLVTPYYKLQHGSSLIYFLFVSFAAATARVDSQHHRRIVRRNQSERDYQINRNKNYITEKRRAYTHTHKPLVEIVCRPTGSL